ncbi:hypothetical protein V8G54_035226 [Vigna mungo]|uniref:Uncharacterized protein n=1 Tax=Vigna mungo TaxID=3915 RepID=A0AAQ3RED6_VIGMU
MTHIVRSHITSRWETRFKTTTLVPEKPLLFIRKATANPLPTQIRVSHNCIMGFRPSSAVATGSSITQRRDFYVVVPSLFIGLEIVGVDVRVSSVMKKMMMSKRRCLLAMVVCENEIWVKVFKSWPWRFELGDLALSQLNEHGCSGGETRFRVALDAESASEGLWRGGYGGLITREDEPVVALMAAWWPYGGALHKP